VFGWLRRRSKFETPEYSVEIQTTFREGRWIVYREKDRIINFSAEAVGRKWEQLNARAPAGLEGAELDRIVANVAKALEGLGYEYVILQRGEGQTVPEAERAEARNRLRQLGSEASASKGSAPESRDQVKLTRVPGDEVTNRKFSPADAVEIMRCVTMVRSVRYAPKILAQSKAANVEFV